MKFNNDINEYLTGNKFSTGLDIDFSKEKFVNKSRIEKIIDICRDKNIIHLGCADHLPLIEKKIREKRWLHKILIENTNNCFGIDNNQEAVDFIKNTLKINDVYDLDITKETPDFPQNIEFDYILLGEIIEHIDNPVEFLQIIREKFKDRCKKIIITVPNVFCLSTINDIKRNKENINTDHRYWFSPFTLTKIALISGYKDIEFSFAEQVSLPIIKKIKKRVWSLFGKKIKLNANCFSSIIIVSKL
ncbi:MAG: class I SAM-dependent methyltransferase [Candidatus Azobacteroides sp.]|nr:class I SAM-dependent methyltransferase [Candidatus Azobacteroides sp.]